MRLHAGPERHSFVLLFAVLSMAVIELFSPGTTCRLGSELEAADLVRPCGPDSLTGPLRRLIPQGVGGADFRPICVKHDACYDTYGANKDQCDQTYLREMRCVCKNSRRPILCRMTARIMFAFTHLGGQEAFDDAQRIALEKLMRR